MPILVNPYAHGGGGGGGGDPAPLRFEAASTSTSNLTTYTFTSVSIGPADANRFVVVAIGARSQSTGRTISSVTVGGVTLTEVVSRLQGTTQFSRAAIYAGTVSDSAVSGSSADITVTFSGSMIHCAVGVWTGLVASTTARDTVSGDSVTLSNIDIEADSIVISLLFKEHNVDGDTVDWSGTDTAVIQEQAKLETSAYVFADVAATETTSSADLVFTTDAGASPSVVTYQTSRTSSGAPETSLSVSLPSASSGNLLVVLMAFSVSSSSASLPSGWTSLGKSSVGYAFYKTATGADSDPAVTFTSQGAVAFAYSVSGQNGAPQIAYGTAATSTSVDPPNIAPSWGSDYALWLANVHRASINTGSGSPDGYSLTKNVFVSPDGGVTGALVKSSRKESLASSENPTAGYSFTDSALGIGSTVAVRGSRNYVAVAASFDRT